MPALAMRQRAGGRLLAALALLLPLASAQAPTFPVPAPDLGPAGAIADDAAGQVVPPALAGAYSALGQNITREDVRLFADLNFSKGDVNVLGLFVGSGKAEIQAKANLRLEMRVISSDRIRAAVAGENAYNVSAENATFLSSAYLPADVFRASLAAEAVAAFQEAQQERLAEYLRRTVPEMDVLDLRFAWSNTGPQDAVTDTDLTEPPIVLEVELVAQYIRIESIPGLVEGYLDSHREPDPEKEGKADYARRLKEENGDPLRSRDFFAAAAYTQLLNLSMQPGWSLDLNLSVPTGYSFTYANDEVERHGERKISLHVDALSADADVQKVFLASITHRRAVALALFISVLVAGLVVAAPLRFLYLRRRVARQVAAAALAPPPTEQGPVVAKGRP